MNSQSILVVGSANVDMVFRTAALPRPGETVMGYSFSTHPGGKGANQAVASGRLGATVDFVGCVGSDAFGSAISSSLASAGVGTKHLRTVGEVSTGTAGILVDDRGGNVIVVCPGANELVSPEQVRDAIAGVRPAVILAQLEISIEAVLEASRVDRFILNPAPVRELPTELIERCFALTPNETELEALTGIAPVDLESCDRACRQLLESGAQNVVVTLGERGSYWRGLTESAYFEAERVDAVDTTAAGDVFNGALVSRLALGWRFPNAIRFANRAAAISTTRPGAQESAPTLAEVGLQGA